MEKDKHDKILIEHSKAMSDYRRTGKISECFYHKKEECEGRIQQSHSIQKNGRLSVLEQEIDGNQMIFTFTGLDFDEQRRLWLKPIGKKSASTFFGFCNYHDNFLFSPIENHQFNDSDEHLFLHSYRSFAHSYHRKKEELKAYQNESKFTEKIPPEWREMWIEGCEISVKEGEVYKKYLDEMIESKKYSELQYFTFIIPHQFPVACSSQISPWFSYKNKDMNNHNNSEDPYSEIMMTVLPDVNQTIIILACFPEDARGIVFLDELNELDDLKLKRAISSILIFNAENTFFAPALWNKLGRRGQRQLCDELMMSGSQKRIPKSFDHSKINFFDSRFTTKNLGID